MIVPPRLAAGLAVCAAAVFFAAEDAPAQNRLHRSAGAGLNAPQNGRYMQRGYLPRHLRTTGVVMQETPPEMVEGPSITIDDRPPVPDEEIIEDSPAFEGAPGDITFDVVGEDACCEEDACGGSSTCRDGDACGACFTCCCCCVPIPCVSMPNNFYAYGGVHGFKGPMNRGADSSFGFNEAINWGAPFSLLGAGCGLGAQLGARGVHSNLSGSTGVTNDVRNQLFITGGLFRRVDCGLQFGAVVDWLHEDWDIELDLAQVRGEISWVFLTQGEFGFRYTGGVADDSSPTPPDLVGIDWMPVDQYALFVRQKVPGLGGEAQVWAGVSGEGEGILGAQAMMPLGQNIAVSADFAYLVPDVGAENVPVPGSIEESWNVGIGLAFFPGAGFLSPSNYYRPLFDVANNGTFFYDID
jgi:hypothetical protein